MKIVTDKSDVTIDMFGNRAEGTLAGEAWTFTGSVGEFELQHRGFLEALETGNVAHIRSPYADALHSFEVAARINQAIYGQSAELDLPDTSVNRE